MTAHDVRLSLVLFIGLLLIVDVAQAQKPFDRPNIIVILADDLGYGSLSSYGATKISTPNMDRLARQGMRFTDAHSPSSVCTPTRYGLLTGRYAWRTWSGVGTVWSDDPLLIETSRLTVPKLLQTAGYRTAIVGKWHLGFGSPETPGWDTHDGPDYNKDLKPGPLEVGFDYFFGIPHTGNLPHVLIENHRVVGLKPDDPLKIVLDKRWQAEKHSYLKRFDEYPLHKFTGGEAAKYKHEELGMILTDRAVKWLEQQDDKHPFFLYFSHRNPHHPLTPNAQFKGTSSIGPYGDFINELDWSVGQVLAALDRKGLSDNTMVILTSDNGGVVDMAPSQIAEVHGHRLNGPFLGQKSEAYEGGNRIPFIVRWPGVVKSDSTSHSLVALTDLLATTAELLDVPLPYDAGEDSFSFLPVLRGSLPTVPMRQDLIMDSVRGLFAVREGKWKLILGRGGGGYYAPRVPETGGGQLFDLDNDIGETVNLYEKYPEIVDRLTWRLKEVQFSGRSHPVFQPHKERRK